MKKIEMCSSETAFTVKDYEFMARAIQLAKRGYFTTAPNPRVGCVLVKDDKIIAEGFHQRAGEPHAERVALVAAQSDVQGATAYVTLEPCCHHGKTPPCTDALIQAGIVHVIIAMPDPNPLVAGQGIRVLEAAGIRVDSGLLEQQAHDLNKGFVKRMQRQLPFVRCKLACSLDGRTAMASGESVWVSSQQSRRDVQRLRAGSCAIMTGIGTVLEDDPSMNVRLSANDLGLDASEQVLQPMRVILDAHLKTPVSAKIVNLPGQVVIFCSKEALKDAERFSQLSVKVIAVSAQNGLLDLKEVLSILAQMQMNDVLLETGAFLAGSMLFEKLVDEMIIYQAPHLMGDLAKGLFHLPELSTMKDRISLDLLESRRFGKDTRVTLKVAH